MHQLGFGSHCRFIAQYPVNQPKLQSNTVNVKTCVNVVLYISMVFGVCPHPGPGYSLLSLLSPLVHQSRGTLTDAVYQNRLTSIVLLENSCRFNSTVMFRLQNTRQIVTFAACKKIDMLFSKFSYER